MNIKIVVLIFATFLASCSGVKPLAQKNFDDLYSKDFLTRVEGIKKTYRQGKVKKALSQLKAIDESSLNNVEKALRRNLVGVIYFSITQYEQAIFQFDLALSTSGEDLSLTSQIHLNLASTYFKLTHFEKAFGELVKTDHRYLSEAEAKKRHRLAIKISEDLGKDEILIDSLFHYLGMHKDMNALKADPYFDLLSRKFFEKSHREKIRLLENFSNNNYLVVGYLGYLEGEKTYYSGEKDDAKNLINWIADQYSSYPSLKKLVENFLFRMENYAKLDSSVVGVVLPLSGGNGKFGKRALYGIDTALAEFKKRYPKLRFKVVLEDSKGSGAVGAYRVRELIEKYNVAAIIGGLFSSEASKEYLESRKHGVFFVSLSQIYLAREQKDHLLLEVPGSVESHLSRLFDEDVINKIGNRAAIIYPKSDRGNAYLKEFWRKARNKNVVVKGALSYEKGDQVNYLSPVSNLLGLKHTRVRKEEQELMKEIHSLEKSSSVRRVNHLEPIVDFDWVFVPSYPREARLLMPSFSYYDAFNITFVGDSSWRSKSLSRESSKFGNLYFIGDNVKNRVDRFVNQYVSLHKRKPRLIEMRSYDSLKIISNILTSSNFSSRDELDIFIRGKKSVSAVTGDWVLKDGVWLKQMVPLALKSNRIENLLLSTEAQKI